MQEARRWVHESCSRLGRPDLADTAQSGVSELVANAILHGSPPISIRMRGTAQHPRVEVFDASPRPPAHNPRLTDEDELLSTTGRGLGIVAMCSRAWGAERRDHGKVVWFEPIPQVTANPDLEGDLFGFDVATGPPAPKARVGLVEICLEGFPGALYRDYRRRFVELSRELRLLALAHEEEYPVAKRLSELFFQYEEEKRASDLHGQLEKALDSGRPQMDLSVTVRRDLTPVMAQMIDLLEVADSFCRAERMLSIAASPQQRAFQRWYFSEFARQARGEDPQPWRNSDNLEGARPNSR